MRSSQGLDNRRKRILYRGWHRGMRELDLIIGTYLDQHIDKFTNQQLSEMESILEIADDKLYRWLSHRQPLPQNPMLKKILNFYERKNNA